MIKIDGLIGIPGAVSPPTYNELSDIAKKFNPTTTIDIIFVSSVESSFGPSFGNNYNGKYICIKIEKAGKLESQNDSQGKMVYVFEKIDDQIALRIDHSYSPNGWVIPQIIIMGKVQSQAITFIPNSKDDTIPMYINENTNCNSQSMQDINKIIYPSAGAYHGHPNWPQVGDFLEIEFCPYITGNNNIGGALNNLANFNGKYEIQTIPTVPGGDTGWGSQPICPACSPDDPCFKMNYGPPEWSHQYLCSIALGEDKYPGWSFLNLSITQSLRTYDCESEATCTTLVIDDWTLSLSKNPPWQNRTVPIAPGDEKIFSYYDVYKNIRRDDSSPENISRALWTINGRIESTATKARYAKTFIKSLDVIRSPPYEPVYPPLEDEDEEEEETPKKNCYVKYICGTQVIVNGNCKC
jgi:hypothetical protein